LLVVLGSPASADGLDRFEKLLKPKIPAGSLTYKSAKGLGDSGFVLEDVTITPPPDQSNKAEPVHVKRISVEDLDFASIEKEASPNFARVKAEGILIEGKPAEGIDLKELAGIDKATADFQLDYRLDPDRKTMTLNRLVLDLNGLGRFELTMILDGVSPDMAGQPDAAMDKTTLRTATLVYEDHSLLSKVVPAAAKAQNMDVNAAMLMSRGMLEGLGNGQGPAAQAVLATVAGYIGDYQRPKGALKITLNPPNNASAASFTDIKSADDAIKSFGLVVSYAGAPAAPVQSAAKVAAATTGKSGCEAGGRLFVYHDDAWWAATARDAGKSGKDCIARIEGESDDVVVGFDKTTAWSIDGPGKAVEKCKAGDKVLVLYKDGGWYPAKVTDDADGKCPIKYKADDDEEKVELKKIRRLD
jgi:hypothetical protein